MIAGHGPDSAFPRWNNHLRRAGAKLPPLRRSFAPGHNRALVVPRFIADETLSMIEARYGQWVKIRRDDLTHYTLLRFTGDPPPGAAPMPWTGLTVLQ